MSSTPARLRDFSRGASESVRVRRFQNVCAKAHARRLAQISDEIFARDWRDTAKGENAAFGCQSVGVCRHSDLVEIFYEAGMFAGLGDDIGQSGVTLGHEDG